MVEIERVKLDEPIDVYNLEVDGVGTYYANGVVVHNKYENFINRLGDRDLVTRLDANEFPIDYSNEIKTWSKEKKRTFANERLGLSRQLTNEQLDRIHGKIIDPRTGIERYLSNFEKARIARIDFGFTPRDVQRLMRSGIFGEIEITTRNGKVPIRDPDNPMEFDSDRALIEWAARGRTPQGRNGRESLLDAVEKIPTEEVITDVRGFSRDAFESINSRPDWALMVIGEGKSNQYIFDLASDGIRGPDGTGGPKAFLITESPHVRTNFESLIRKGIRRFAIYDEGAYTGQQIANRISLLSNF